MKKIIFLSVLVAVFLAQSTTHVVYATDPFSGVCDMGTSDSTVCQSKNTTSNPLFGPDGILTQVTQLLAIFAGAASIIMIMVGGLKYIISAGESAKVSNAKDTVLYACIGLIVAALAQAIVMFVLKRI